MLSREQGTSEKRERGMMGTSAEREQGVMGRKRRVYFRPRFPLISSSNISQKVIASDWEQGEERAKRTDSEISPLLARKEGLILRL